MRACLLTLHRWLALLLTPLFLLITLTGMVLAFKPVLSDLSAPPYAGAVDTVQLIKLLEKQSGQGNINMVQRSVMSGQWMIPDMGEFQLDTAEQVGNGVDRTADFFAWVKELHKDLLLDAGDLVEWVTYVMLAIMVVGVLLGWPKFSQSLIGWHQWLGVWLLPLALLLPLTAILMTLHIGRPDYGLQQNVEQTSLVQGIRQAAVEHDLSNMTAVRRFKAGSVMIQLPEQLLVVSGDKVTSVESGANLPKQLHEGLWAGWFSGIFNALVAGLVGGLTLTGGLSWLRRQRAAGVSQVQDGAQVLVVFASQTGTAQGLATATAGMLEQAGIPADQGSIAAFKPADWKCYQQVLVIASTTGDGELPEMARSWVKALPAGSLKGVHFSLLALGDRRYEHFCAGGHQLQQALFGAGATEQVPLHEVDADPAMEWASWLKQLGQQHGWALRTGHIATQRQTCTARLIERVRLDTPLGDDAPHSYSLIFEVPETLAFAPGDLFQFQPQTAAAPRTYSIGSASATSPGHVRLTVGLLRYKDDAGKEVLGLGSSELCLNWPVGETREIELVAHPGFHPPKDLELPLIMVATGCGIAPFIGFLEERAHAGKQGPVWLLFGNRHLEGDYLYRDQIEAMVEQQVITDLDTVFSRDGGGQRYISERLEQHGDKLLDWIGRGAALYVCGRASTLGKSVDEALIKVLCKRGMSDASAHAELERWRDEGVMHCDLFD
ncbi:MAG: nitric oxide synthase [Oceanospirillales bacterium]|nr:nitric oxide synthase [Oceanospirillales bacterium]